MRYKSLSLAIVGLTALLTWAAVELVPEMLFFPVVEYTMPGDIHFAMFKGGELDRSSCEQTANDIGKSVRAQCRDCSPVERCLRGLSAERKTLLSREPLALPSVRTPGNGVTMTISTGDAQMALSICRLIEQQSASQPAEKRARCWPAYSAR